MTWFAEREQGADDRAAPASEVAAGAAGSRGECCRGACAGRSGVAGWGAAGLSGSHVTLAVKSATVSRRGDGQREGGASMARARGLLHRYRPTRVPPSWEGAGRASSRPSGMRRASTQFHVQNSSAICFSRVTMGANFSSILPQRRSWVWCAMASTRRTRRLWYSRDNTQLSRATEGHGQSP